MSLISALHVGLNIILFACGFVSVYFLLRIALPTNRRRPLIRLKALWETVPRLAFPLNLVVLQKEGAGQQERKRLLEGCGVRWSVMQYCAIKRLASVLFSLILFCLLVVIQYVAGFGTMLPKSAALASAVAIVIIAFDKPILQILRRQRARRIVKEVFSLSRHLLYYSDSRMNIHAKLIRCIPYTKTIRREMHLLVNEWYQDAEKALAKFKVRLGTEEGYSFAETIHSIRLHESEHYYDLLRQRIEDYKDKMELFKESKQETTSYVLFVIAGIPIFNTFRIFIHPWVAEGQKLFESLN